MITEDVAWLLADFPRVLGKCSKGLRVCDLGNQRAGWYFDARIKYMMTWLGYDHVSIDTNGKHESLVLDLSKPLPSELLGTFDLVTNAGTTEHINTTMDFVDQWQVFKSIHELAREQAVFIHVIPDEQGQHIDCKYVYSSNFLGHLAEDCKYEIKQLYDSRTDEHHMVAMLKKTPASRFPDLQEFQDRLAEYIIKVG